MVSLYALLVTLTTVAGYDPDFWAVLVAGSTGMNNYRHQADVCHSYHLLLDRMNVDPSHVIVMMYDDVAWSLRNPLIGRLFNAPNGPNVYAGCHIDYRAEDVHVAAFLNVLINRPAIGMKGLESNSNSTVFVSFVDHGEPGSLLFPHGEQLTAQQFINTLHGMNGRFARMVIYVEACNAGSVFEGQRLPPRTVAVAAANASESSWGTYCPTPKHPSADQVNGVHIGSCLGDLFSVTWMKDMENRLNSVDWHEATLGDHIHTVQLSVAKKSNVMVYGDTTLLDVNLFDVFPRLPGIAGSGKNGEINDSLILDSAVPQRQLVGPYTNSSRVERRDRSTLVAS